MDTTKIADSWIEEINKFRDEIVIDRDAKTQYYIQDQIVINPSMAWSIIKKISSNVRNEWEIDNFSTGLLSSFVFQNPETFHKEINSLYKENADFRAQYDRIVFRPEAKAIIDSEPP